MRSKTDYKQKEFTYTDQECVSIEKSFNRKTAAYRKQWLQVFHFLGRHNQAETFIRLRYIRSRIWSRYSAIVASLRHSSMHLLTSHDSWINSTYIYSHDLHSRYGVPGTDFVRVAFERFYLDIGLTRSIERRLKSLRIFPRVIQFNIYKTGKRYTVHTNVMETSMLKFRLDVFQRAVIIRPYYVRTNKSNAQDLCKSRTAKCRRLILKRRT